MANTLARWLKWIQVVAIKTLIQSMRSHSISDRCSREHKFSNSWTKTNETASSKLLGWDWTRRFITLSIGERWKKPHDAFADSCENHAFSAGMRNRLPQSIHFQSAEWNDLLVNIFASFIIYAAVGVLEYLCRLWCFTFFNNFFHSKTVVVFCFKLFLIFGTNTILIYWQSGTDVAENAISFMKRHSFGKT